MNRKMPPINLSPTVQASRCAKLCSTDSQVLPKKAPDVSPASETVGTSAEELDAHRRKVMERAELELSLLNELSRVLGSTLDLHSVFDQTMRVLADRLGMEREVDGPDG